MVAPAEPNVPDSSGQSLAAARRTIAAPTLGRPLAVDPALVRRSALALIVSSTLFAIMAALTKSATHRLPGPEVALLRFLAGVLLTGGAVAVGAARIRRRSHQP